MEVLFLPVSDKGFLYAGYGLRRSGANFICLHEHSGVK